MKRLLLYASVAFALHGNSQTTLYQETFETGNSFSMNSSDMGGFSTYNTWLMNNVYFGGSGTFVCLGFPFSFTVVNTPSQPAGIAGFPSSNYMHITAQAAISSGITCASYIPADGTCAFVESNFTKMTTAVSTVGYSNVTFDFWWMCAGSVDAYGQLYYSLDNGATWVLKQSNMNNTINWSQTAVTDPLWSNQASIKFAFRFVNNIASTAADPSFCLDQLTLTGMASTNSITTSNTIQPTSWCFGNVMTVQVNFTATGTYTAGNVYTAQLSDASGSFASPTTIGTLNSTASGAQMIVGVIPGNIPVGSGYRIRVISSNPVTIGTDNGSNLEVLPLPIVQQASFTGLCVNDQAITLSGGTPAGGTYSGTGVSGGFFNPNTSGAGTFNITYSYATAQGCSGSAIEPITVNALPTPIIAAIPNQCDTSTVYTLLGTPPGGTFAGPGVTGSNFDASSAGIGTWTLSYDYTDGNGCSAQAIEIVNVTTCTSGLDETSAISLMIYPNPTDDFITISAEVELTSIVVLDVNGRIVKSIPSQGKVNISDLNAGVYFIQIEYNGQLFIERIAVK